MTEPVGASDQISKGRSDVALGWVVTEGVEPCGCRWRSEVGPDSSSSSYFECETHRAERIHRAAKEAMENIDFDLLRRATRG